MATPLLTENWHEDNKLLHTPLEKSSGKLYANNYMQIIQLLHLFRGLLFGFLTISAGTLLVVSTLYTYGLRLIGSD